MELEEIVEMSSYLLVKPYPWSADSSMIHSNGSVRYALLLSLESFESYQMDRFTRKSNQQMCKNLEALLTDDSSGDLKIKTRDGATISAHKNILKSTHETLKVKDTNFKMSQKCIRITMILFIIFSSVSHFCCNVQL